jgi:hypothetical protein
MARSHAHRDTDYMETFLPTSEKVLRNAYPNGVLDHCGLASIANSRELLIRDHTLTVSFW